MKHRTGIIILLTVILSVILTVRFYSLEPPAPWGYVNAGAVNPYYGVMRPLGYRVLMPVVLNLMHIIPTPGDPRIPVPFAVLLCVVFYGFLRAMTFSARLSLIGVCLLACCGGMIDLLKDFGINNADTSSHILILLALWAMIKNQDAWFSTATLLGVFNREWALVLLPLWYLYHYGWTLSAPSLRRLVRVSLPSLLVYGLVRYVYFPNTALGVMGDELGPLLPASETTTFYYYWSAVGTMEWRAFYERVVSMQFYTFGMVGLLPYALAGYRRAPQSWQRAAGYYTLLCVLQLAITTDVWRLAFYLFPILIPGYLYWLQDLEAHTASPIFYAIVALTGVGYLVLETSLIGIVYSGVCLFILSRLHSKPDGQSCRDPECASTVEA
ncbi:MAG: hypothetical protein RBU29_17075 [bacterium]|jgi:hypothetical protein|nr:hypothetical protein [bacterium]